MKKDTQQESVDKNITNIKEEKMTQYVKIIIQKKKQNITIKIINNT